MLYVDWLGEGQTRLCCSGAHNLHAGPAVVVILQLSLSHAGPSVVVVVLLHTLSHILHAVPAVVVMLSHPLLHTLVSMVLHPMLHILVVMVLHPLSHHLHAGPAVLVLGPLSPLQAGPALVGV